ncbi:hypothetical protein LCGC14_1597840 [marine sediment metagenome]|uniref:Uncharacterized protein n=1 Tax=marine sediment metagenome TaxID=412755 RepID=A0A0F9KSR1_9ZZZZ
MKISKKRYIRKKRKSLKVWYKGEEVLIHPSRSQVGMEKLLKELQNIYVEGIRVEIRTL